MEIVDSLTGLARGGTPRLRRRGSPDLRAASGAQASSISFLHRGTVTMDSFVEIPDLPVLRVRADFAHGGPPLAFRVLESRLPTLRGRHFYGWAESDYYACVVRVPSDEAPVQPLESGTIPGGLYARRKIAGWESQASKFPAIQQQMVRSYSYDRSRPCLEHYRSQHDALLMVPVHDRLVSRAAKRP